MRFGGVGVALSSATVATGVGVGAARLVALRLAFFSGGFGSGFSSTTAISGAAAGIAPVITHVAAPTPLRHRPSAAAAGPSRPPPVETA